MLLVEQHTVVPLPLAPGTVEEPPTHQLSSSQDPAFMYAAIAILISALILVGVACGLSALMYCSLRAKHKRMIQTVPINEDEKTSDDPAPPLFPKAHQSPVLLTFDLRRTSSTIGFPTAENLQRPLKKTTQPSKTATSQPSGRSTSRRPPPTRSQSVPNLAFVATTSKAVSEPEPRRRDVRKPLTRVKVLNVDPTGQKLGRAKGEAVGGGTVVRKGATLNVEGGRKGGGEGVGGRGGGRGGAGGRARKSGAAPVVVIQNNLRAAAQEPSQKVDLASYAVRKLATSVETPEPGSQPITEL